jgi:ligand-binding sensor domain-containing protein
MSIKQKKYSNWKLKSHSILILVFLVLSCKGQHQLKNTEVIRSKNGFNSVCLDSQGILWFGSNGGGVYSFNENSFTHFTEKEGLSSNQVFSITEDRKGDIWFGTANGISKFDGKKFIIISIPQQDTSSIWLDKVSPVINPNAVHSLIQDKKGSFWMGTAGGGVYHYDEKIFIPFLSEIGDKYDDSLQHNWVPSITEDVEEGIWFASMSHGGVSRYNGKNFTHFSKEEGLSDDMVRTIFVDKAGTVWFGFNGNRNSGLTSFNGKIFQTFTKEDGLCNTNIMAIYEDKKGQLWLGSGRGNLCIFDGGNFTEFTSKNGETFSHILFITEDKKGTIWFGGINGLWKYDGTTIINMIKNN